jgi:hypothetical protein
MRRQLCQWARESLRWLSWLWWLAEAAIALFRAGAVVVAVFPAGVWILIAVKRNSSV